MPTTQTKSVGSTGRDFATLNMFVAAIPTNLVTADEVWVAECYNDSEFVGSGAAILTLTGHTTDATRYIHIKAAAGQSFSDHASVRSHALIYNQANGVGIRSTGNYVFTIVCTDNYTQFTGLQIQSANGNGTQALDISNTPNGAHDLTFTNCILSGRTVLIPQAVTGILTFVNCLLHARGAGLILTTSAVGNVRLEFCTLVRDTNGGNPGSIDFGTLTVENCAIFNFTTAFVARAGTGALAGGHNATDLSSAPGSSNQTSLTYSNQVENTASDWRAKVGGSLVNGVSAPTYATTDISGFTRGATPTIGAWELPATGPSGSPYYAQQQQ